MNLTFSTNKIAPINFLVGPNGSGKSRFAATLRPHLSSARLLGTDRLSGMEQINAMRSMFGDHLAGGFAKNHFPNFRNAGEQGSGIDTVMLLEERLDLRIQVEATLSYLFNRKIILEWDSGNLIPRAILGEVGESYRLDRDECHGIKELLVLLTHLYNDQFNYLIIDEPELNLHPQYQAFFMQEVRKIAGDPSADRTKKIIFLITHSPFILDFRSMDDVKAVISFSSDYSVPKILPDLDSAATARLSSLVPRLNVHHKQLFFSDNPIFVEGILDAQIVGTMQEARGVSIAAAGSCIIDAGGAEEVNRYLELCTAFGKQAHFLYDLDSLFGGTLRSCLKSDGTLQSFLATAGVGGDFAKYCGELESKVTHLIDGFLQSAPVPAPLERAVEFLKGLGPRASWDKQRWAKARVAAMTALSRDRSAVVSVTSEQDVAELEGRLNQIVAALRQKKINLLPGGTLERYLPLYAGDHYDLKDEAKKLAVLAEIEQLARPMTESELEARYGALYRAVASLPSKVIVDLEPILRQYLSRFIHEIQTAITNNPKWDIDKLHAHLNATQQITSKVFFVETFARSGLRDFAVKIRIAPMIGNQTRYVHVSQSTNAGVGDFKIE